MPQDVAGRCGAENTIHSVQNNKPVPLHVQSAGLIDEVGRADHRERGPNPRVVVGRRPEGRNWSRKVPGIMYGV
ncbi:hypothetical protein FRUB_09126 [Fimbriiglobus ruber]|uniref:Uncharacterized protein n=1 Tax=Fimbriiglobus ruber TaxID=1908690 RepID=A0A225D6F3_9BACT|nr:hypothetical protein FRUB_09126 [Fimbriiglobus ruber]